MRSALIIFLAFMLYGLVHSLLAAFKVKDLARRRWGAAVDRWYRLLFNIIATITLLPVTALFLLLDDRVLYNIPTPLSLIFMAIQVAAVGILVYGVMQTGALYFAGIAQAMGHKEPKHALITTGPYRWVRHPLYTAGLLFIWFTPLMTANFLALNISLTVYILVGALHEEQRLLAEHGKSYAQYRQQVPMLIPQPWRPRPTIEFD